MFLKNKWIININLPPGKYTDDITLNSHTNLCPKDNIKFNRRRLPIKYWYRSIKGWWNELLTLKLYVDIDNENENVKDILKILNRIKEEDTFFKKEK